MPDQDCLFCRIVRREIKADIVAEEDSLTAFKDSNPQAPTHILIIPNEHLSMLADAQPEQAALLGRGLLFANRLAKQHKLEEGGYRVVVNNGAGAGQTVFHLHFHLLGGRPMRWPPG